FLAAVVTKGQAVVGVAHLGRRPNAAQQTALQWLYPTCAVEGCASVARLEVDHRIDWSATRVTVFDLLDRLCPHHHRLKTREGWGLVEGREKRAFVPPQAHRPPVAA
ncbi:MAG: HNH endonuclease, partial [Actinomycetota bacterium]|nr:HNH endonuclease [Actinomycetota bacterium]